MGNEQNLNDLVLIAKNEFAESYQYMEDDMKVKDYDKKCSILSIKKIPQGLIFYDGNRILETPQEGFYLKGLYDNFYYKDTCWTLNQQIEKWLGQLRDYAHKLCATSLKISHLQKNEIKRDKQTKIDVEANGKGSIDAKGPKTGASASTGVGAEVGIDAKENFESKSTTYSDFGFSRSPDDKNTFSKEAWKKVKKEFEKSNILNSDVETMIELRDPSKSAPQQKISRTLYIEDYKKKSSELHANLDLMMESIAKIDAPFCKSEAKSKTTIAFNLNHNQSNEEKNIEGLQITIEFKDGVSA